MRIRNRVIVLIAVACTGTVGLVGLGRHGLLQVGDTVQELVDEHFEQLVSKDLVRLQGLYGSIRLLLNGDRDSYQAMLAQSQMAGGGVSTERGAKLRAWFDENVGQARQRVRDGASELADEGARATLVAEFDQRFGEWHALASAAFAGAADEHGASATPSPDAVAAAFDSMRDVIDRMQIVQEQAIDELVVAVGERREHALQTAAGTQDQVASFVSWFLTIGATVALLVASFGTVLVRGLLHQLKTFLASFRELSQGRGDLTRRMDEGRRDEFGELAREFNLFSAKLEHLVIEIRSSSNQIQQGSMHLATTSGALAQSASRQASSLQEMTVSCNQLAEHTKGNAGSAEQASKLATTARDRADTGRQRTDRMMEAMELVSRSSGEIAAIVKVIDEIAFNTNLLALNASVEAARAGDAGKGFAVVAGEVRDLAQRSATAARDISERIDQSVKRTSTAAEVAQGVHVALDEIVDAAVETSTLLERIVGGTEEQSRRLGEFDTGLVAMDEVSQCNAASSEELAAAVEETAAQVQAMNELVALFKVGDGTGPGADRAREANDAGQAPEADDTWSPEDELRADEAAAAAR